MSFSTMWFAIACLAVAAQGVEQQQAKLRSTAQRQQRQQAHSQLSAAAPEDIKEMHGAGFVRSIEFKHQLRVCNAFPSGAALHIYRSSETRLTGDAPMPYKACRDFQSPLRAGDRLEFHVGDASSGTFSVSDLPNTDAVLLLVLHRHDTAGTSVAFESHVFSSLASAQVAIIDTYKARAHAANQTSSILRIMDAVQGTLVNAAAGRGGMHGSIASAEELRYDSVVAVNPGIYEVELDSAEGKVEDKSQLVALKRESYVVLRTGLDAELGPSYPEELVIYPNSNPGELLRDGAAQLAAGVTVAWVLAMTGMLA